MIMVELREKKVKVWKRKRDTGWLVKANKRS